MQGKGKKGKAGGRAKDSAAVKECIEAPFDVVQMLYREALKDESLPKDGKRRREVDSNSDFGVRKHFAAVLKGSWHMVPLLNSCSRPEQLRPGSLVRFRCMIQNMHNQEYYIGQMTGKDRETGEDVPVCAKFRDTIPPEVEKLPDVSDMDVARNLWERQSTHCIPIPGETMWAEEELKWERQPGDGPPTNAEAEGEGGGKTRRGKRGGVEEEQEEDREEEGNAGRVEAVGERRRVLSVRKKEAGARCALEESLQEGGHDVSQKDVELAGHDSVSGQGEKAVEIMEEDEEEDDEEGGGRLTVTLRGVNVTFTSKEALMDALQTLDQADVGKDEEIGGVPESVAMERTARANAKLDSDGERAQARPVKKGRLRGAQEEDAEGGENDEKPRWALGQEDVWDDGKGGVMVKFYGSDRDKIAMNMVVEVAGVLALDAVNAMFRQDGDAFGLGFSNPSMVPTSVMPRLHTILWRQLSVSSPAPSQHTCPASPHSAFSRPEC